MRTTAIILLATFSLSITASADPACPGTAIASDTTTVTGAFGDVVVDVCITRSAGMDTYTYRLTYLGDPAGSVCGLLVSGKGDLETTSMSGPGDWVATAHPVTSCASWWTWSEPLFSIAPGFPMLSRTLTLSVTVGEETVPAPMPCTLAFCGKESILFWTLGPSDPAADARFEGEGPRVNLVTGPVLQTVLRCEPWWVQHGLIFSESVPASASFSLFLDGVEVPLVREVTCEPFAEVDTTQSYVLFHRQFNPDELGAGVYELTGVWSLAVADSPPDGLYFERTISVEVLDCAPEPIPVPSLPDLRLSIEPGLCACDWARDQTYVCDASITVTVTNEGTVESPATGIRVGSRYDAAVAAVPELQPGAAYQVVVDLSFESNWGKEPCPFEIEAMVDISNSIEELDEENNTASAELCCP